MVSWTIRNSHISLDKALKYITESFSAMTSLMFVVYSVDMLVKDATRVKLVSLYNNYCCLLSHADKHKQIG